MKKNGKILGKMKKNENFQINEKNENFQINEKKLEKWEKMTTWQPVYLKIRNQ